MRFEKTKCPICKSRQYIGYKEIRTIQLPKEEKYSIVKCLKCGMIFLNPRISKKFIKNYYSPNYYCYHNKPSNETLKQSILNRLEYGYFKKALDLIEKNIKIKKTTRILDIGCGSGTMLYMLKKKYGCHVLGYDINERIEQFEKGKYSIIITNKMPKEKFDLIISWHFLEHDYAPLVTLKKILRILDDDGKCIFQVPNIESKIAKIIGRYWRGYDPPRHLNYFSGESFKKIFKKAGFQPKKIIYSRLPGLSFPTWISFFSPKLSNSRAENLNILQILFVVIFLKFTGFAFETFYNALSKKDTITLVASKK
jgi:SAM-dependent methyltransferase